MVQWGMVEYGSGVQVSQTVCGLLEGLKRVGAATLTVGCVYISDRNVRLYR